MSPGPPLTVSIREAEGDPLPLVDVSGRAIVPPSTTVSFRFDAVALHATFRATGQPPFSVGGKEVFEDECVELFLSGAVDETRYREIVVNPRGDVHAALVHNPDDSRATWTVEKTLPPEGLSLEVSTELDRWICRLALPWSEACPAPRKGETRRGNAYRIARTASSRFEALSPTLRDSPPDFHVPSRFAVLLFE